MKAAKEHEHEEYKRGGGVEKKKRDHEKLATGGVIARKRGGGIKPETARLDAEGTHDNYPEVENMRERAHQEISVRKRHGGKVEGKKPHHRMDRRARGGALSAPAAAPAPVARARGGAVHGGAAPSQGSKVSHSAPKRPEWPYSGADVKDPHYTRGAGPESKPEGKGRERS